ncbi:MAG: hypothetical protein D6693_05850 [Planctomycetota bacterium]|nr:MAG: hypothetical protein D6693_05850 [Planctomycetota bacterium]
MQGSEESCARATPTIVKPARARATAALQRARAWGTNGWVVFGSMRSLLWRMHGTVRPRH